MCVFSSSIHINNNSQISIRALNPKSPTKVTDFFFFIDFSGFWVMYKY